MSKGPRADVVALLAIASAAALGIAFLVMHASTGRADALTAVPADSFLVLSIDVPSLGQSPLAKALVGEQGSRTGALLGVESMMETCGFDPLPHLRSIVLAVPEGGERGDFGVAASGDLASGALSTCARAVIAKRGGQVTSRQVGTFTLVSAERTASTSIEGPAEVAFRDGGPFLVGRGIWLTHMIDAAEGRVPSLATSSENVHHTLRVELSARDADASAVVATAILPQELRARLQHEVALEGRDGEPEKRSAAMDGVLSVAQAGFALHAGRPHEDTRMTGVLHCESPGACEAVSTLILHTRLRWSGNLGYRIFGLGGLIDNLEVLREGTTLTVKTHAPVDDLAKMIDRAFASPSSPSQVAQPRSAPLAPASPAAPMGQIQAGQTGMGRVSAVSDAGR